MSHTLGEEDDRQDDQNEEENSADAITHELLLQNAVVDRCVPGRATGQLQSGTQRLTRPNVPENRGFGSPTNGQRDSMRFHKNNSDNSSTR